MEYRDFEKYYKQPIVIGTFEKAVLDIPRYYAATNMICDVIPLNCTYHYYNVYDFGTVFDNGSATGKYKDLQDGVVDTFIPHFTPTEQRLKAIDFSDTAFYADVLLVTRAPKIVPPASVRLSMLEIVKWEVWLVFLIAIVITSCITGFMTMTMLKAGGKQANRFHWILYAFTSWPALITHKHDEKNQSFDSLRLITACWSLAIMVLSASYTGMVFSNQMQIADPLPYDSLETFVKCLEEAKCQIIATSNSSNTLNALFYTSPSDLAQRSRATFQERPIIIRNPQDILPIILGEQDKYIAWVVYRYIFASYYKQDKINTCPVYAISTGYEEVCTYPLKKHSRFKSILNWAVSSLHEMELSTPLTSKVEFEGDVSMCGPKYFRSSRAESDNSMIYTSVVFLGGIMLVSTVLLVLEILSRRCACGSRSAEKKLVSKDPSFVQSDSIYSQSW